MEEIKQVIVNNSVIKSKKKFNTAIQLYSIIKIYIINNK